MDQGDGARLVVALIKKRAEFIYASLDCMAGVFSATRQLRQARH